MAGLLHGKVLRSPHAHARIRAIDVSRALALPGVKAVVTGTDLPPAEDRTIQLGEGAVNLKYLSNNILAGDKVLYKGHPVAAVAATSPHLAEEALALIQVDYDVLPPVLDVREAMQDSAPLLHENLKTKSLGQETDNVSNVATHNQFKLGDVEKGFQEADVVIEREFTTATVHQGYIEPHNATAMWNADGQLTIWESTQGAFTVQRQLAPVLGIPGGADPCHSGGDRRRLRGENQPLPGAHRGCALQEDRASGQGADESRRGVREHGTDAWVIHPRQNGRHQGWACSPRPKPTWPTKPEATPARRLAPA